MSHSLVFLAPVLYLNLGWKNQIETINRKTHFYHRLKGVFGSMASDLKKNPPKALQFTKFLSGSLQITIYQFQEYLSPYVARRLLNFTHTTCFFCEQRRSKARREAVVRLMRETEEAKSGFSERRPGGAWLCCRHGGNEMVLIFLSQ